MHAIFFAMGPSIKKQVVLPPTQSIEYLNLFIDLLGLPHDVPNNGTIGIMDEILVNPPFRTPYFHFPLNECPVLGPSAAVGCSKSYCSSEQMTRLNAKLACNAPLASPVEISSTIPRCFQNYCEKYVITESAKGPTAAVLERIVRKEQSFSSKCEFVSLKYGSPCEGKSNATGYVSKSLSADSLSELANIQSIIMTWEIEFNSDILEPLNEYTKSTVQRLEQLVVITGTAFDSNLDGIADTVKMRLF
ncbi:unnamed protein product [Strongylus vulgaris]|uniref:Uncharacterized protein n=1 Tax=Strongylus vulgaris TaxID=40348 RepID=A0A3P7ICR1_STRVU|nr:unnamed protein product [Strongylus vulgaris]